MKVPPPRFLSWSLTRRCRRKSEGLFEQLVVTNSISIPQDRVFPQLKVLSVANMLGEAIWRIHEESSVSSMFR